MEPPCDLPAEIPSPNVPTAITRKQAKAAGAPAQLRETHTQVGKASSRRYGQSEVSWPWTGRDSCTRTLAERLVEGYLEPGEEMQLRIDQTLTHDATLTLAYLQADAIGTLPRRPSSLLPMRTRTCFKSGSRTPTTIVFL